MSPDKINFGDSCQGWKKLLHSMKEETDLFRLQVENARKNYRPGVEHGLQHFENRFASQRQVIGLLSSQLEEICASYQKNEVSTGSSFGEQLQGFKTDIDRVALLFSRLKEQFKAYLDEYAK
jgi:hypothetical protein